MLTVQNREGSRVVFVKGDIKVEWQRAGDLNGEDIQQVPEKLSEDIDFIRTVSKGILEVLSSEDPDTVQKLNEQADRFAARRKEADAGLQATIDRPQDRSMSSYPCIAPVRGGTCDNSVMMRLSDAKERPPLCERHRNLATSFVASDEGSAGDPRSTETTHWTYSGI